MQASTTTWTNLRLRRRDDVAVELGARELGVAQVDVALPGAVDVAVAGVDEEELGLVAAVEVARHLGVEAGELVEDGGALGRLGVRGRLGVEARGVGVEDDEERGAIGEEREQLPGLGAVVVGELQRLDAGVERAVLGDDDGIGLACAPTPTRTGATERHAATATALIPRRAPATSG